MSTQWFEIDKDGLSKLVERRGHGWLLFELIQNAIDTDATRVDVTTDKLAGRPRATIRVEDNSTHGFIDLSHAWTMFAPSTKAADPELRGRFNVGEKLFLALAIEATIETTTGGVVFDQKGRRKTRATRDRGTLVNAEVKLNNEQYQTMLDEVNLFLPPEGVDVYVNGRRSGHREPDGAKERAYLPTEVADEEGRLVRTWRYTKVEFHRPRDGETPTIFEMGIPVVETEAPFHINVAQTVPLSMDRDNVTPAYARDLYAIALDTMVNDLDDDEVAAPWVTTALPAANPESVVAATSKRFGDDAVVYDPSSPESNKEAIERGRTIIPAAAFDKGGWDAIRRARETTPGFAEPAGRAIPVGVPTSADGKAPISESEWTERMHQIADYSAHVAEQVGVTLHGVNYIRVKNNAAAWWDPTGRTVTFNLTNLGAGWTETVNQVDFDELLIHELAHGKVSDHLTRAFSDECCRIGATMRAKVWKTI
jgi:hypothetical protein